MGTLIELAQETIDQIFADSTDEGEITLKLYQHVYPQWEQIQAIEGWPTINTETQNYIWDKFREFYQQPQPPLSLWFNNGFSTQESEDIPAWQVQPAPVVLKGEHHGLN